MTDREAKETRENLRAFKEKAMESKDAAKDALVKVGIIDENGEVKKCYKTHNY
jgi:hypothetical protein